MWFDLLKVKDIYLQGRSIVIQNGEASRFWYDPWLHKDPLYLSGPNLFELCENKDISVAQVLSGTSVTFRRWLFDCLKDQWDKIMQESNSFQLKSDLHIVRWSIESSDKFSVKVFIQWAD